MHHVGALVARLDRCKLIQRETRCGDPLGNLGHGCGDILQIIKPVTCGDALGQRSTHRALNQITDCAYRLLRIDKHRIAPRHIAVYRRGSLRNVFVEIAQQLRTARFQALRSCGACAQQRAYILEVHAHPQWFSVSGRRRVVEAGNKAVIAKVVICTITMHSRQGERGGRGHQQDNQ